MSLGMLEWKYPGVAGIDARMEPNGDIVITKWPAGQGPQPTPAEIRGFVADYAKHVADEAFKEKRRQEVNPVELFDIVDALLSKVRALDGELVDTTDYDALKTRVDQIKSRNPEPSP